MRDVQLHNPVCRGFLMQRLFVVVEPVLGCHRICLVHREVSGAHGRRLSLTVESLIVYCMEAQGQVCDVQLHNPVCRGILMQRLHVVVKPVTGSRCLGLEEVAGINRTPFARGVADLQMDVVHTTGQVTNIERKFLFSCHLTLCHRACVVVEPVAVVHALCIDDTGKTQEGC